MKTSLKNLLDKSNNTIYSFADEFNTIIEYKIDGYDGKTKDKLKSFFDDLQKGGCMSGIIGDFIYHSDCKDFYIKHIEDLEDFKEELEYQLGQPIQNRHKIVHYTFVVWLCFEEYCYDLYNTIFEN
jgi:hypothetical protein